MEAADRGAAWIHEEDSGNRGVIGQDFLDPRAGVIGIHAEPFSRLGKSGKRAVLSKVDHGFGDRSGVE